MLKQMKKKLLEVMLAILIIALYDFMFIYYFIK